MREGSVGATIVGGLFAKQPELEQLVLEWVSIFYFGGAEYRPGHSWLQATYDGRQILAFLPEQSVFRYNGRLFALLQLYPTAERDEHGLTTSSISEGYQPEAIAVALNSPKLQSVTALWLSYREQRGLSTMYRLPTGFVDLDHVPYTIESQPLSSRPRCSLRSSSSASGRLLLGTTPREGTTHSQTH